MSRPVVAICTQGGGPEGDRLAGASARARDILVALGVDPVFAGASIGAIVAVLLAAGFTTAEILTLLLKYLQRNRMLDFTPKAVLALRLLEWERIGELVRTHLGPTACLGDLTHRVIVCVSDLDSGQPHYVDSEADPQVRIDELLRASCAVHPRITGAHTIPSLGSALSPDIKRKVDGGWTDNTVDGVHDQRAPRIAVRLEDEPTRVRSVWQGGGLLDDDIATFKCALNTASRPKSKRADGLDIVLPRGRGWDFSKTPAQVRESWGVGVAAADAVVGPWYEKHTGGQK